MAERKYYELHVAGLTRQLPLCEVNPHLDIAGFVIFGDVEMTVKATEELPAATLQSIRYFLIKCYCSSDLSYISYRNLDP